MSECLCCKSRSMTLVMDFGCMPLANDFLAEQDLKNAEKHPLKILFCRKCFLVQVGRRLERKRIFNDAYPYLSSCTPSLVAKSRDYCRMVTERFGLAPGTRILEIASNDGYLLSHFKEMGHDCILGVEPVEPIAKAARSKGVPTLCAFFDSALSLTLEKADLVVANNVLTHVPDPLDFIRGIGHVLGDNGVATLEFQHLLELVRKGYFDLFYHEHCTYLSLLAALPLFRQAGLVVFDVEKLDTQGGSLRVYVRKEGNPSLPVQPAVAATVSEERLWGLDKPRTYLRLKRQAGDIRRKARRELLSLKKENKRVICYGAAAKGTVFLNYIGADAGDILYAVDRNLEKHGLFIPGCGIQVHPVEKMRDDKPDCIIILPWNLKEEIMQEHSYVREWGGNFITLRESWKT